MSTALKRLTLNTLEVIVVAARRRDNTWFKRIQDAIQKS